MLPWTHHPAWRVQGPCNNLLSYRWTVKSRFSEDMKKVLGENEGSEPATRGVNVSRSKFLPKSIRRPISQNHHKPSRVLGEVWNSYGRAKPTQNTPRTCERKHGSERENLQTWQTWTGQTALSDRSDRFQRPGRPVAPRQIANKASNGKSRANVVQIQRNLEDSFASTP